MVEIDWGLVIASVAVIVAIIGTIVSGKLTRDSNKITKESSDNARRMNEASILFKVEDEFLNKKYKDLQNRISNKLPILTDTANPVNTEIVFDYLSLIQKLGPLISQELISIPLAYNFWGRSVILASEHEEIKNLVGTWFYNSQLGKETFLELLTLIFKKYNESSQDLRK